MPENAKSNRGGEITRSTFGLPDKPWLNMQEVLDALGADYRIVAPWFDGRAGVIQIRPEYKPGRRQKTFWRIPFDVAVAVIRSKQNGQ